MTYKWFPRAPGNPATIADPRIRVWPNGIATAEAFGSPSVPPPPLVNSYEWYAPLDLDAYQLDLVTDGFTSVDTLWVPDAPEEPTITTTVEVDELTPAATRTAFIAALANSRRIIVRSSAEGAGTFPLYGYNHLDIILAPGVRVDEWALTQRTSVSPDTFSTCHHVRWRGGEHGFFSDAWGYAEDLIWDGCVIANNRWLSSQNIYCIGLEGADVGKRRVAIVNCVMRANVARSAGDSGDAMGFCMLLTDHGHIVMAGNNCMSKADSSHNGVAPSGAGNWVLRSHGNLATGTGLVVQTDNWMYAGRSYVDRDQSGRIARVTSPVYRGTDRRQTFINLIEPSNITTTGTGGRSYTRSVRIVMDGATGTWDPDEAHPGTEVVWRDTEWRVRNSGVINLGSIQAKEDAVAHPRWILSPNGHTFVYTGSAPTIPTPPIIASAGLLEVNDLLVEEMYPEGEPQASFEGTPERISDPRDLTDET